MNGEKRLSLYQNVNEIAGKMLAHIEKEGASCIVGGNNGPYYDKETNVRNMAHWCATFAMYFKRKQDERYKNAAICLADAIMDSPFYNGDGVYKCREPEGKDEINGVIGPAWIMEGLLYAYGISEDVRYFDRALALFQAQPFCEKLGIWNRRNTKGEKLSVDVTFNHQLWFAAAGAMLCFYGEPFLTDIDSLDETAADRAQQIRLAKSEVDGFVKRIPQNLTVRRDGRIGHFTSNDQHGTISAVLRRYRECRSDLFEALGKPSMAYKEAGYHMFNLYGFAVLKEYYHGAVPYFNTKKFLKCLNYIKTESYALAMTDSDYSLDVTRVSTKLKTKKNVFACPYNSPAFEMGRVLDGFEAWDVMGQNNYDLFLEKAEKDIADSENGLITTDTDDPHTLTARVYELVTGDSKYFDGLR